MLIKDDSISKEEINKTNKAPVAILVSGNTIYHRSISGFGRVVFIRISLASSSNSSDDLSVPNP